MFIDFHVHVFPDEIAPKAMEALTGVYPGAPLGDGTVAGTLAFMDKAGVDVCVPQPVATRPSQVQGTNDWVASIRSDRVIPFGAMHLEYPDPRDEVDRLLDMGFRGIKLQPGWQAFYPDEERVFPVYEAAEGRLAVLFHAGHELQTRLLPQGEPGRIAKVHRRFPGLTIIAAHMGGFRVWDESEKALAGENVYLDMSFCPEDEMPDPELTRLIKLHGPDKVLFASDFPMKDPGGDAERLSGMELTNEEKEDIAWRTAARLLGLP
jgi:uncharacterized protein